MALHDLHEGKSLPDLVAQGEPVQPGWWHFEAISTRDDELDTIMAVMGFIRARVRQQGRTEDDRKEIQQRIMAYLYERLGPEEPF